MVKIKGLLFDYGGTLDTGGCHWGRFIWHGYEKVCLPVTWEQYKKAYAFAEQSLGRGQIVTPEFTFWETLRTKLQLQLSWLREQTLWKVTDDQYLAMVDTLLSHLYNKVGYYTFESRGVLEKLKKTVPMALVTNFYGNIGVVLREFQLDSYFSHVVESANVGVRKPNPTIFKMGTEALQMKPEDVLVVGDSIEKDIIPAKQVGCKTAWLKGETWDGTQQEKFCADHVITNLSQLITLLK